MCKNDVILNAYSIGYYAESIPKNSILVTNYFLTRAGHCGKQFTDTKIFKRLKSEHEVIF